MHWGSEIQPFEIWKHLKSGHFEGLISNGPVFKWSGFSYRPFKIRTFLSGFQMVFDKMAAFVRISNGWASGFQIPFEIQTICNPTSFGPFEIQTRSDFRSPLCIVFTCVVSHCDSRNSQVLENAFGPNSS